MPNITYPGLSYYANQLPQPASSGSGGYGGYNMPYMPSGGGGGGWLSDMASLGGTGFMVGGPVGAAIGAGLGLIGGIAGGLAKGKKRKEARKTLEKGQKAYQQKAEQLFPELSKESFLYQNPAMQNAITAALTYRLGNMFGNWGMPPNMRGGMGSLNQFFQGMMPQLPSAGQPLALPPGQFPGSGMGQGMGGNRGGGGGWYDEFRQGMGRNSPRNMYAY